MSFQYQPLLEDEIRLLTIEPIRVSWDQSNFPEIVVTLENVRLGPPATPHPGQRFKGHGYTWPELMNCYDTAVLFKNGKDPLPVRQKSPTAIEDESIKNDATLPWRYPWGDFIALSYVWGPQTPRRFITVNGTNQFGVTPNLYDALIQLRRTQRIRQGFKVWIDAICINQDDLAERSQQVSRMCETYQSAWQVVTWIGPEADNSSLAMTALQWLADQSRQPEENPLEGVYQKGLSIDARPLLIIPVTYRSPFKKSIYKALFKFFCREYWRRMWIIQEMANGRSDMPIMCGDRCMAFDELYRAAVVINNDQARFGRDILDTGWSRLAPKYYYVCAIDRLDLDQDTKWSSERLWKLQVALMQIQRNQKDSPADWQALVQVLLLARESNVTEEKDRVYGILGVKAVVDRVPIVPDYNIPLATSFSTFTSKFLATGDLSILRLVSRTAGPTHPPPERRLEAIPTVLRHRYVAAIVYLILDCVTDSQEPAPVGTPCIHNLPSWAVCWTCKPAPTIHLRGTYRADQGMGAPLPVYVSSDLSITVKGIVLDTITSLGTSHPDEAGDRYPSNILSTHSIYGDLEATRAALWRTIVANTTFQGNSKAPESYSWLLEPRIWASGVEGVFTHGFGLFIIMSRNKELTLCGYTLEHLIFGPSPSRVRLALTSRYHSATDTQREAYSWATNVMAWRRLFGTKDGRMGLGSAAARTGDSIVIMRGCNTPMILRKSGENWTLVGECYVDGIMYGEVIADEHHVADIKIY